MDKKKKKSLDKATSRHHEARDSRRPKEELWQECYEIWRAYREERDDDKSNLFIPYLYGLVETVVPRITDTIFAKKPYLKPMPKEPQDIEGAEANEVLMEYQFKKSRFEEKVKQWIKQTAIYGTGFVKIYWDRDVATKTVREKRFFDDPLDLIAKANEIGLSNISSFKEVEKEIVKYEGANIEVLDVFDVYVDPYAESIEDARYVTHETLRPKEYVKQRIKSGVYNEVDMDDWEDIEESAGADDSSKFSVLQRQEHIQMANEPNDEEGMIKILEYWEDNRVITVANESIVLRDKENPFNHKKIPIVEAVDTKSIKELYGIGEIEPNRYLQAELNTNRNQRIENVKFAINNSYFYDQTAIDEEDFVDAPNAKIPVRNRGQRSLNDIIYPVPKKGISRSAYTEEEVIKRDMQETTGVTQYVRGIQPSGSATATEITSLQKEANYRFKQKIRNIATALEKVGEMWIALNQQFVTEQQYIRIAGDRAQNLNFMQPQTYGDTQMNKTGFEFLQVAPEDIAGEYDIEVASTALEPLANKEARRQQLLQAFQMTAQAGLSMPTLLKEILKTFDDITVMDKIVKDYEQQMQQRQQIEEQKFQAQNKGNPQSQQVSQVPNQPPNAQGQVNR
jgi:hypothetical protein